MGAQGPEGPIGLTGPAGVPGPTGITGKIGIVGSIARGAGISVIPFSTSLEVPFQISFPNSRSAQVALLGFGDHNELAFTQNSWLNPGYLPTTFSLPFETLICGIHLSAYLADEVTLLDGEALYPTFQVYTTIGNGKQFYPLVGTKVRTEPFRNIAFPNERKSISRLDLTPPVTSAGTRIFLAGWIEAEYLRHSVSGALFYQGSLCLSYL
jgi:hypothetical protein